MSNSANDRQTYYTITLYGCPTLSVDDVDKATVVFRKSFELKIGTARKILDLLSDYNRIADKYGGTLLPASASLDEHRTVMRWEEAYEYALQAAFVGRGAPPEDVYFDIRPRD